MYILKTVLNTYGKILLFSVFIIFLSIGAFAQATTVTGIVTSEAGSPISGASITVKGTTRGTSTNAEGRFSISANPDATLVISSIGFTTQEVAVSGRTDVSVTLAASSQQLEQVVVIGYGAANKRDLTGSIQTVKGREVADKPATNPVASLQGKVPGLTIVNSGRPGQEPDIRIRGTNTIAGVKPLYVVDGIFNDNINFLNPADIESMEILKDPSSLAIFGVRGANGVIIISTKRAKAGQLQVNFNSTVGVKQVVDKIEMTNASQFKMLYDEQLKNQGSAAFNYTNWTGNTDWQDLIFQDAMLNYNNVSITGASDKNRFYMGIGYITEEGLIKHEKLQKITLNFSDELQVSKALKFGLTLNGYRSKLPVEKSVGAAVLAAPIAPAFNTQYGLYHTLPDFQRAQVYNPIQNVEGQANTARNYEYRAVGSIFGEVNFLRHLNFRTTLYADYGFNTNRSYSPIIAFYNPDITTGKPIDTVQRQTSVAQSQNIFTKIQGDYLLTYKNRFGGHNLTVLGGVTSYYNSFESTSSSVQQGSANPIPNDPRFWYANSNIGDASTLRGSGGAWEKATFSYLLRGLYSYRSKYLLNASFRRDGSSAFPNNGGRWQNFGAIGAGWVISEEDFMNTQNFANYLKLKASWGILGNQNTGRDYPYFPTLTGANSGVFGNNIVQALVPLYFVDPNLHWETVHSWEAGLELNTLKNKLHFEANYYSKLTKDILVEIPASFTAGGVGELSNVGEVSNKGFEFLATYNGKINNDWSYTLSGNLTTISNKVESLVSSGYTIINDPSRTEQGYPIGYFYGYVSDGVYQTNEEIIKSIPSGLGEVKPGDIKFRDTNGDGVINEKDRTIIGNPTPDFTYSVSFNLNYKALDFSVEGQGVYGNEIFRNWGRGTFAQFNYPTFRLDRWHGAGTSNWEPILHTGRANNYLPSTYHIEDGSYFRIRNIQVGYNFTRDILSRLHITSLRIFVNAQNLKTFKNNTGYTPEFGGGPTSFGVDNGSYPLPAIYTFGVNLNF